MSDFNEMVPEFISKMDESLAEIGFTFGEQWNERTPFTAGPEKQGNSPAFASV
ncbi:exonuclease [Klebsiella pneumoniae]|nr:exonuclease [Klebsiella pneumoniae]